jgi:small subunit ribosomal protein S16
MNTGAVDGAGDPNTSTAYADAVSTVKVKAPKEEFQIDASKKSVLKPKVEKKAEEAAAADEAEAPAADATDAE